MKRIIAIFLLSVTGMMQASLAAPGDVALGLKAGTLGAGLEATFEVADRVNMRVGANYFKFGTEVDVEGNDYDLDLKLNSYSALADWFVTDSSFRITGGAMINNNKLAGIALPSNSYEIDDTIYTAAEVGTLTADIEFTKVAPYLGIGWGNPLSDDTGWSYAIDLGVMLAGKPKLDITSTGGTLSNDAALQDNIAQAEQDFRDTDEIKYLKIYPVISFGLNYRF
ncbi:hypothetical protein [Pseudemcibacter aquimaris]|uniref:hypothetical protein n=1 Tax=Pseudemcibacter aquimaris TaxID=2857064 RepID=UPI002012B2EA|nr:hypothetical protein [Pseudemcibacter aquimaris]MCC3861614.1 hypothetical protein [Pseudemcibacter aquimaris]WDU58383.1 hypothetical protein KW060_14415 [Pseudemcibacter aquimaris]